VYDIALKYLSYKLSVLPAIRTQKRPSIGRWKDYQKALPVADELETWFARPQDAICVVTGKASGNLEIIDFDNKGELYSAWKKQIPQNLFDKLVIEQTPSGGYHAVYRCESDICGNMKLAQRKNTDGKTVTLIETRGEGGLFLCAPTDGYKFIHKDFSSLQVVTASQRGKLLESAWALNEFVPDSVGDPVNVVDRNPDTRFTDGVRPGDAFNDRGKIRELLVSHGWQYVNTGGDNERWRRPGKKAGWSATLRKSDRVLYVFSSNAAPFDSQKAYSPFAVFTILECNGDYTEATKLLAKHGYGDKSLPVVDDSDVDLSAIMKNFEKEEVKEIVKENTVDPGFIPLELMRIPGFISELMDFCMKTAPYPNQALAFCGALAMQSFLCGRKVRDAGNRRTNLYLLALAGSGSGKDWPRQINSHIMVQIGQSNCLGDKFASGEGMQDALYLTPNMLFQNDEIDGLLRTMKRIDGGLESIMTTLLTMYTNSGSMYPMRRKAGKDQAGVINQPHLTLFGTATPKYYYEALDERMLTNGLFARMIVVDIGTRGKGQDAGLIDTMDEKILETAKFWIDLNSGVGNLCGVNPDVIVIEASEEARETLLGFREFADAEYVKAESKLDEAAKAIWSRANENARKLALLYAASENHRCPEITAEAASWACRFVDHQIRRMLYLADAHVSSNDFDGLCMKLTNKLKKCPG